jgi:hypothetical protein
MRVVEQPRGQIRGRAVAIGDRNSLKSGTCRTRRPACADRWRIRRQPASAGGAAPGIRRVSVTHLRSAQPASTAFCVIEQTLEVEWSIALHAPTWRQSTAWPAPAGHRIDLRRRAARHRVIAVPRQHAR